MFAIEKSATARLKVKMKMLLVGFPWLSVMPPSSLAIDTVIEVFSSFELLLFVVDAVDVVDVSVSASRFLISNISFAKVFLSCPNHRMTEHHMNLRPSFCSSVR